MDDKMLLTMILVTLLCMLLYEKDVQNVKVAKRLVIDYKAFVIQLVFAHTSG